MVGPIYIIAIALGLAFTMGLFGKSLKSVSGALLMIGLAAMTFVSGQWLWAFMNDSTTTVQIFTAGFKPPYSIMLSMGINEAIITLLINVVGLIGGIYLFNTLVKQGKNAIIIFLIFIMGLNVIVLTQDIFNLFVFLEVQKQDSQCFRAFHLIQYAQAF